MSGIQTEFIETNNLTFEVNTCGTGDRLALCLHGFPECAYSWRLQMPMLADLGYRVWAPNLRGYGKTTRPINVADYKITHLVHDVADLVDAAQAKSVVLIAHDWGGAIAWFFAIRQLRPLQGLIVLNIPHPAIFIEMMKRPPQLLRSWYIFFFQIPWLPEWLLGLQNARGIGDAFRNMAVDKGRFPEEVLEVFRDNARQPGALTAMLNYYRAFLRYRPSVRQRRQLEEPIDTPTLMIWGEHDTALGKELTYGTEKYVKDFTLHYLPNVSHWVQQEAPERVNELIAEWLSRFQSSALREQA